MAQGGVDFHFTFDPFIGLRNGLVEYDDLRGIFGKSPSVSGIMCPFGPDEYFSPLSFVRSFLFEKPTMQVQCIYLVESCLSCFRRETKVRTMQVRRRFHHYTTNDSDGKLFERTRRSLRSVVVSTVPHHTRQGTPRTPNREEGDSR